MTYAGGWYWGWYSFTICIGSLGNSMEYISASSRATPNRMGLLIRHPGGQSCHSDRCYQNAELTKKEKHNSELGTEQSRIEAGGWLARKQLCRKGTAVPVHKRLTGNQHSIVAAAATCGWGCSSERGAAATNRAREQVSTAEALLGELCPLWYPQTRERTPQQVKEKGTTWFGNWGTWHLRTGWREEVC